MKLLEIDTFNKHQVKQFLKLPFRLYKDIPQWVPPMDPDAKRWMDKRTNPFFSHSNAAFFLVVENDHVLARLAVLNNRKFNDFNQEKTAFFYLFECEENSEASKLILDAACSWAQKQGLNKIFGPKGFTPLDGFGMLVKGFEHRPAFGLPYNLPYYPQLVEGYGFSGVGDSVSGYLESTVDFPNKIHQVAQLIQERRGLEVIQLKTRRDLKTIIPKLKEIYNAALGGTSGNVPLSDDEVKTLTDQMLWFADPKLIKIVMKDEQPVGFLFAYPDISAAFQRTGGRLFPFGWLDMLLELRRTKWININGAGMIEGYRGIGGTALLFSEMHKSVTESRYKYADIVQIGMENENMQREMRGLGIDFYKAHRVYQLDL